MNVLWTMVVAFTTVQTQMAVTTVCARMVTVLVQTSTAAWVCKRCPLHFVLTKHQ